MGHDIDRMKIYEDSFKITVDCLKAIKGGKPFELSNHIIKTAISIPSNIAEGAQRSSNRDFKRFLTYSTGSIAELTCQLHLAEEIECGDVVKLKDICKRLATLKTRIWAFHNQLEE